MTETPTTSAKLFNHLEKVRALMKTAESFAAKAETPCTCKTCLSHETRHQAEAGETAGIYRAKAEEFMRKYRLDEEELIASGDPAAATPIMLLVDLCEYGSEFFHYYAAMAEVIAEHVGARVQNYHYHTERKQSAAAFVGYESDVRVAVEILTAAQMVFTEKLSPKKDDSLSEAENIYRLRSSGVTRRRVAVLMWGWEADLSAAAHAKVGRIYKEECARRGEPVALDGKGIDLETFREAYAREFYWRLDRRLEDARSAIDRQGGVVVLHSRKERVDEAFYGFFPDRRPKPKTEVAKTTTEVEKPRKLRQPTKADQARVYRRYHSAAARAGEAAGGRAADGVQINRTSPKTNRLDEPGASGARGAIAG